MKFKLGMPDFSFIILTYNEELHLPRLLSSIEDLQALVFVLDSGSNDSTLEICKAFNATVKTNAFENHPRQWNVALTCFDIKTPLMIALDADKIVTPELCYKLKKFKYED